MNVRQIADKGIWTAKKRYIPNAWDAEGVRYKEPSLKIMGIEAVKSSTPAPCREKIKEVIEDNHVQQRKNRTSLFKTFGRVYWDACRRHCISKVC